MFYTRRTLFFFFEKATNPVVTTHEGTQPGLWREENVLLQSLAACLPPGSMGGHCTTVLHSCLRLRGDFDNDPFGLF